MLTFHRCINYGSYWQARCLVDGLRVRGFRAELLDHKSRRVDSAEWRCALQPVLPASSPGRDRLLYAIKVVKFFRAFASLPRSPRFALEDPTHVRHYETVVVGSDEVWNLTHPWYGRCPLFYGDGVRARRLVSYAASFGNFDACGGLEPTWADRLRRFGAISVRDENSRRIVRDAIDREPELVLDPSLQFPQAPEGPWRGPESPFVAVYGHSFSPWFARAVRDWAVSRGYPLVSFGYRNNWAGLQWLSAGPHDFAHGIARAEAVVTNFFHGCAFALRYEKPFVCEATPYRATKVQDLMRAVGGEHHLVSEGTSGAVYDARLTQPLSPAISQSIRDLRATSNAYLASALA